MLISLAANAEHGKRREAGDYRKAYDIACRYGLVKPKDSDAVAKRLRCSIRWARELTAEARERERTERDEAARNAPPDETLEDTAKRLGVSPQTVSRAQRFPKGKPSVLDDDAEGADPFADARVMQSPTGQHWHRALEALRAVNAQADVSAMFADRYRGIDHAIEPELRRAVVGVGREPAPGGTDGAGARPACRGVDQADG